MSGTGSFLPTGTPSFNRAAALSSLPQGNSEATARKSGFKISGPDPRGSPYRSSASAGMTKVVSACTKLCYSDKN
ncbi:MAG: hypothetical protein ACYC6Y_26505, partial [Thermoguttaceae bacterium]